MTSTVKNCTDPYRMNSLPNFWLYMLWKWAQILFIQFCTVQDNRTEKTDFDSCINHHIACISLAALTI